MLGRTRSELLESISSEELTLWIEELKMRYEEEKKASEGSKRRK